jgi:cold shock CspA family protein
VAGPVPSTGPHRGRVASFDPRRGLGEVEVEDGTVYGFHATAIADGSRRIEVGAPVVFTISPAHRGLYEARALTPVAGPADPAG